MTRRVQELSDQRAAGVRLGRLRVGDGEHPAADAFRRVGLVIARSRSRISHCSGVRELGAISGWPATRCAPAPSRTPPLIPPESRELGAISGWPATRCAPAPSRTPPLIPPESREPGAISGWPSSTRWSTRMPDLWAASPACMVVGLYRVRRAPWSRTSEPLGSAAQQDHGGAGDRGGVDPVVPVEVGARPRLAEVVHAQRELLHAECRADGRVGVGVLV